MSELEKFVQDYERALETQQWNKVESLIHKDACITFSNGKILNGISAIEVAYKHNFSIIKNEKFSILNLNWLKISEQFAIYTFEFHWQGLINGNTVEGNGLGTTTIIKENGNWQIIAEHLGKAS